MILQFRDFTHWFTGLYSFLESAQEVTSAIMLVCAVNAIVGLLVFEHWRKFTWCAFNLVLALAVLKSEQTRQLWSIWDSFMDDTIWRSYLLESSILLLIPIQVGLWKLGHPVIIWVKLALGYVAGTQAIVTVFQFFMLRYGYRDFLNEWGLNSALHLTPRDSSNVYREATRLTGLVFSPVLLGMILVMTWPVLLIEKSTSALTRGEIWTRILQGVLITCVMWAIFLTYTRAAYIGLFLQFSAIVILTLIRPARLHRISRLNIFIIVAALASALLFIPAAGARVAAVTDTADASITNRLAVFQTAANLLSERPISGWGPGFFNLFYNSYYKLPNEHYTFFDTHSATLNTLMELGIAGMLLGVIAIFGTHWKILFQKTPVWIWLALLGVALPVTSDNPSSSPAFMFPAIWIAGAICVISISIEKTLVRLTKNPNRITGRIHFRNFTITTVLLAIWLVGYFQPFNRSNQRVVQDKPVDSPQF